VHEPCERPGNGTPSSPRPEAFVGHAEERPDDRLPPENPLDRGAGNDDPDELDDELLPKRPDDPDDPDELDDDLDDELLPNSPPRPDDPLLPLLEEPDDETFGGDDADDPELPVDPDEPELPDDPKDPEDETRGGDVAPPVPLPPPDGAAPLTPADPPVEPLADDPDPETRGGDVAPLPEALAADAPVDPEDEARGGEVPALPLVPGTPAAAGASPELETFGGAGASAALPEPTRAGAPAAPRLPAASGTRLRDSFFKAAAGASVPWLRAVAAAPLPRSPARPTFLPVTFVVRCVSGGGSLLALPPLTRTGGVSGDDRSTMIGRSMTTVRGGS
jgi:hypothetical protein